MSTDIEKRKAEIMAKAQAEMAKAELEAKIIDCLPIVPAFVHVYSLCGRVASARYNPVSKDDAKLIFEAFPDKLPSYACKTGTTKSIRATDDEKADEVTQFLFSVHIEKHSQCVCFYINTPHGIVEIEIDMGFSPYGQFYVVDKNRTKYFRWEFKPENRLLGLLRVANYARVSSHGDMSAPHMVYAGFEAFEFYDSLGLDREG